jgi:hypothetical protein
MLYPDGSDAQKFWVSQARNAFTAFTLYLFENFDVERKMELPFNAQRFPTLGEVYRLSRGSLRLMIGVVWRSTTMPAASTASFAVLVGASHAMQHINHSPTHRLRLLQLDVMHGVVDMPDLAPFGERCHLIIERCLGMHLRIPVRLCFTRRNVLGEHLRICGYKDDQRHPAIPTTRRPQLIRARCVTVCLFG